MKRKLMRRSCFSMLILLALGCLASCGDDAEGRIEINDGAPAQVSNVQSSSGPGEVYLSWNIPASSSFMYAKVEYTNSKGEERYILLSKERADDNGVMKTTVSGFANTDPVEFSIYACSVRGNNIGAQKVTATPGTPAYILMLNSVEVEPANGGVNVSWKNESVAPVTILLAYQAKEDASRAGTTKFQVSGGSEGTRFVSLAYGSGDILAGNCVVNVATQDAEENTSEMKRYEPQLPNVQRLDRSGWTVPGFADTYDPAIGYSSQEAGGEGAYPNGRVMALFDGNEGSFWHTAWKQTSAYPHFVIVDMGKDIEISLVSLRRRTGNNGTHKGQTFYTCTDAKAGNKADPASWAWEEQGAFSFDPNTDAYQFYQLRSPQKARYLKVFFSEADQGNSAFVMLSELNIYGIAE